MVAAQELRAVSECRGGQQCRLGGGARAQRFILNHDFHSTINQQENACNFRHVCLHFPFTRIMDAPRTPPAAIMEAESPLSSLRMGASSFLSPLCTPPELLAPAPAKDSSSVPLLTMMSDEGLRGRGSGDVTTPSPKHGYVHGYASLYSPLQPPRSAPSTAEKQPGFIFLQQQQQNQQNGQAADLRSPPFQQQLRFDEALAHSYVLSAPQITAMLPSSTAPDSLVDPGLLSSSKRSNNGAASQLQSLPPALTTLRPPPHSINTMASSAATLHHDSGSFDEPPSPTGEALELLVAELEREKEQEGFVCKVFVHIQRS